MAYVTPATVNVMASASVMAANGNLYWGYRYLSATPVAASAMIPLVAANFGNRYFTTINTMASASAMTSPTVFVLYKILSATAVSTSGITAGISIFQVALYLSATSAAVSGMAPLTIVNMLNVAMTTVESRSRTAPLMSNKTPHAEILFIAIPHSWPPYRWPEYDPDKFWDEETETWVDVPVIGPGSRIEHLIVVGEQGEIYFGEV